MILKKILIYTYFNTIEVLRSVFNKILYTIVGIGLKISNVTLLQVYHDSNGWFLTYRFKDNIYKIVGPFLFFRFKHSFLLLKKNLLELKNIINEKNILFIPNFEVSTFYLKFNFIKNTTSISNVIIDLNSSQDKVNLFVKLLNTLDDFHNLGFCHGDLKPKNILIDDTFNIYFIDLEDIKILNDKNKIKDYAKLIPRIIYFLNKEEVTKVVNCIKSEYCKEYIQEFYLKEYNIKQYLEKFSFIEFEKDIYTDNEDIDITVPNFNYFLKIKQDFMKLNLDIKIFHCCTNDFKIYIYNQNKFNVIDIHIKKTISVYYLLYLKMIINKHHNIFITGPDGIGKTTVINNILKGKDKFIYDMFNINFKHANRFVQNKSIIFNSKIERLLTCRYFGCILKKNIIIIINKWRLKSIVSIYDRSFIDVFIGKDYLFINTLIILIFGKVTDIILLVDIPKNILNRKEELSENEIKLYYKYFKKFGNNILNINVKDLEITEYKLNSLLKHKLLTKVN